MAVLTFLAAFLAVSVSAGDHPAIKIIALLEKLQAQVKEEGATEAADYAKFTYWCTETQKGQQKTIDEMTERITQADAEILSLSSDIEVLSEEIGELNEEMNEARQSKREAQTDRNTENGKYLTAKSDLQDTVDAIGRAISSLETSMGLTQMHTAVEKAVALIELYSGKTEKTAEAFLQKSEKQAPAIESEMADTYDNRTGRVRQYDFKSGGVIETLKQLKLKFEDQLIETNKAEAGAQNAWTMADGAKEDEIKAAERSKQAKVNVRGRKMTSLNSAETTKRESTTTKGTTEGMLDTTKKDCRTKADEWAERSQRREGEVEAMSTAVEVLKKVTHVRTPEDKGVNLEYTGFTQVVSDPKSKIVNLLRQAAKKAKATQLMKLADSIAAVSSQTPGSGTFDQIKNMIEKMIFQLMAEQKDEDDHKNWCDLEIAKTNKMKGDKETRRNAFNTDIGVLRIDINGLTNDINENTRNIATMESNIETQTDTRNSDKAENSATVKDAQDAQNAVDAAIAVLTDFYKSTGEVQKEAWEAFVQVSTSTSSKPSTWASNSPYTGVSGGSGVINMLESIAADFASMEAEAKADETAQQATYDEWMTSTAADKAAAESDSQVKTSRRSSMEEKLQAKENDADHNQKELDAVVQYESDLQKPCLGGSVSYTDRKGARSAEITALRQAQDILDNAFNGE